MAASKDFRILHEAGATIYGTVYQVTTGYMLNDATGLFSASPADFFLAATPSTDQDSLFLISEARSAWADGTYIFTAYDMLGVSPDPDTDFAVAGIEFEMLSDVPVTPGSVSVSINNSSSVTTNTSTTDDLNLVLKYVKELLKNVKRILDIQEREARK